MTGSLTNTDPLANTVWHALTGPQEDRGQRLGGAARFDPDISPFAAVGRPDDARAWDDLATLVGPRDDALLFREAFDLPRGWVRTWGGEAVQLSAPGPLRSPRASPAATIASLGAGDAAAMAALVAETRPGPWAARTQTLGPYFGVWHGSRLVAMAGTRLHVPPHREISAVCTAADHRGRGLAAALILQVAEAIRDGGDTPFLHAATTNTPALRLYRAMGFEAVREVTFGGYRRSVS